MDLTPEEVSGASFRTVRKGYDPEEVDAFLERTATALEASQQQATAMEARARAAVARLQEVSAAAEAAAAERAEAPAVAAETVHVRPDESETISRTLLLAQRTADAAIADAQSDADRIRREAQIEHDTTLDSARQMSAKLLEDARAEARQARDTERVAVEDEVGSLVARREFLLGDVDQLEQFLTGQRERLRAAARQIEAICERVPAGLAAAAAPAMSASDQPHDDDTGEFARPDATDGSLATLAVDPSGDALPVATSAEPPPDAPAEAGWADAEPADDESP